MKMFEQFFPGAILSIIWFLVVLDVAEVESEYTPLKFVGCYYISPFITQKFNTFPGTIFPNNNANICRNWCIDKRVVSPNNSLLLVQQHFCLCMTSWNATDLKGPLIQLLKNSSCSDDYKLQSFTIYEYSHEDELTTTIVPLKNDLRICPIEKCCILDDAFVYTHQLGNYSYTSFIPMLTPLYNSDDCAKLALSIMNESIEPNHTIVYILVTPIVESEGTLFNCSVFTLLYESPIQLVNHTLENSEIVPVDATHCETCKIWIPSEEEDQYCGGSLIEDDILNQTFSSLYYITYDDKCLELLPSTSTTELIETTITSTQSSEASYTTECTTEEEKDTTIDEQIGVTSTPTDSSSRASPIISTPSSTSMNKETETSPSPLYCKESEKCNQYDTWNNFWTACYDEIAMMKCINDKNSFVSWKCLPSGQFEGPTPDYSNCKSDWIEAIEEKIDELPSLPPSQTQLFLDIIYAHAKESIEQNKQNYYGHEIRHIFSLGKKLIDNVKEGTELATFEYLSYKTIGIMSVIFEYQKPWEELDLVNRTETGTEFIYASEAAALELTERIARNQSFISNANYRNEYSTPSLQMGCGAQLKERLEIDNGKLSYPFNFTEDYGNYLKLPDNWTDYFPGYYKDVQFVAMQIDSKLVNVVFPGNISYSGRHASNPLSNKFINSKLLSFTFNTTAVPRDKTGINFTGNGIKIHFTHEVMAVGERKRIIRRKLHPGESPKAIFGSAECVFWDPKTLIWSTEGCELIETNKHKSMCNCFHLSSFALLMDTHNYVGKDRILEILTWIICPFSIVCLFLCILTFTSSRSQRTDNTINLCVCLVAGNLILLTFSDRNYFHLTEGICALFGLLLHYFFLAAFIWMGIEGIQLYRKVIIIFESGKDYKLLEFVAGYGIPFLVVGTTWTIGVLKSEDAYGGDEFCWLEGNYIWAFLGPILLISIANLSILFASLRIAYQVETNPKAHVLRATTVNSVAKWIRGTLSLSVLLGVTWLTGFLMLAYDMSIFVSYVFTILNGSQGILLFLFHCYMNPNVMESIRRKFCIGNSFSSSLTRKTDSSTLKLASSSSSFNTDYNNKN